MESGTNPLGILSNPWNEFKGNEQETIKKINQWDFTFLTGDQISRQGVKLRTLHDEAIMELKKFFAIKVIRDIHPMGCFGPIVAAAWHAFILDTLRYEKFCSEVYGKTIHHLPSNYGKGVLDNSLWMSVYKEWFGPFTRVWKLDLDGNEIHGYELGMNVRGNIASSDMDSDDGAFP